VIDVWVPGLLRPAPRPRVDRGRAHNPSWYTCQKRKLARDLARLVPPLGEGETAVTIDVLLPRPKSHWCKAGLAASAPAWPPARAGDVDNLAKAVLDALVVGGVLPDDSQVVDLTVRKAYAPRSREPGFRLWISVSGVVARPGRGRASSGAGPLT
jgi:Holliday junction resolvase RusA-like endonuclease